MEHIARPALSFKNKDIEACYHSFAAPRAVDLAQFRTNGFQRLMRHMGLVMALPTGLYLSAPLMVDTTSVFWIQQFAFHGGAGMLATLGGVLAMRHHRQNEQNFVKMMVDAVSSHFGPMTYLPRPLGCDSNVFASHGLFNNHHCRTAADHISGEYKGAQFDMVLADLQEITRRKSKKRYFKGFLLDIDMPDDWGGEIRLMPKQGMLTRSATQKRMARGGFQFAASEHIDFGEKFDVYAQNPADIDRILTPQRREKLLAVTQEWKGKGLHVSISGSRMLIALPRLTRALKLDALSFFRSTPKTLEKNAAGILAAATLPHRIIDILKS